MEAIKFRRPIVPRFSPVQGMHKKYDFEGFMYINGFDTARNIFEFRMLYPIVLMGAMST